MSARVSLYDISIRAAVSASVKSYESKKEFRLLPNNVLFDFYYTMFTEKKLCLLAMEFSVLDIFNRMLSVKHNRVQLLRSFQALMDHGSSTPEDLVTGFRKFAKSSKNPSEVAMMAIRMCSFFNEGGWYTYSKCILDVAEKNLLGTQEETAFTLQQLLQCYHIRIYAETIYCDFKSAEASVQAAKETLSKLERLGALPNLAGLYANFSVFYFHRSEYDEAYSWGSKALDLLDDTLPKKTIIEVLRHASRACVVKRRFAQAGLLIRQAYNIASIIYERDGHPNFADTLLDYGFYLLNYDAIQESVKVYERSLQIRKDVFEKNNIQVALAHEDMAYALYVNEYSSGRFYTARENAERSIRLMERILPGDHLLLSSAKRVKALILEEIALDMREGNHSEIQEEYLKEAEQLHQTALKLSLKAFGEKNVQTAKHYGNLGRLYQSMKQYEEAEKMHLKAIAIKEELLGLEDYEVGLSIGHLASLYNYHMKRPQDAEKLYIRSMTINLNLFGENYSGFEYDYRGLISVYSKMNDQQNVLSYTMKMREWNDRRSVLRPVIHTEDVLPVRDIVDKFVNLC